MRNRSQSKGFTLTELLIASILIVFTAAGTFVLLGGALQLSARRSHSYEAYEYASQTLDTLKDYVTANAGPAATPNPIYRLTGDPSPGCGGGGGPSPRYALLLSPAAGWRHCHLLPGGTLRDQLDGKRTYTVTNTDLDGDGNVDFKRVTVTVRWTERP